MNVLRSEKQSAVTSALVEGNSIRSVERMTWVHRDTIMRLLQSVGEGCQRLLHERMRNVPAKLVQVDEIWTFVQKKQKQHDASIRAGGWHRTDAPFCRGRGLRICNPLPEPTLTPLVPARPVPGRGWHQEGDAQACQGFGTL